MIPAFPAPQSHSACLAGEDCRIIGQGMSLRDYFAAKVLPHMSDFWRAHLSPSRDDYISDDSLLSLASACYRIADAMIVAREPKP